MSHSMTPGTPARGALASEAREEKRRVRNAAVLRIAESRLVLLRRACLDVAAYLGYTPT